jgi:hypothetical protein
MARRTPVAVLGAVFTAAERDRDGLLRAMLLGWGIQISAAVLMWRASRDSAT